MAPHTCFSPLKRLLSQRQREKRRRGRGEQGGNGGKIWGTAFKLKHLLLLESQAAKDIGVFSERGRGLMNNLSKLYTPRAYMYNIWLSDVVSHFFHPCHSLSGAVRCVIPYSSLTNLTPQPLFFLSPSPLLLFLRFSPHLFIKLMRLKLGPSSQGE